MFIFFILIHQLKLREPLTKFIKDSSNIKTIRKTTPIASFSARFSNRNKLFNDAASSRNKIAATESNFFDRRNHQSKKTFIKIISVIERYGLNIEINRKTKRIKFNIIILLI